MSREAKFGQLFLDHGRWNGVRLLREIILPAVADPPEY